MSSWGYAIVGGLVGLVAGMALGKKSKSTGSAAGGCPVSDVSRWATLAELAGMVISTTDDLSQIPPEAADIVVVQETCAVYEWNGSEWEVQAERTRDLRKYLDMTPSQRADVERLTAPVSRPTPNNVDIPAGPRPVP